MYFKGFQNPWMKSLAPNLLDDMHHTITLVQCHDLVISGAREQLKTCLGDDPGIVLQQDIYGFTLLHWAVLCSTPDVVQVIINAGADVNAYSRNGGTVLMWATESTHSAPMCKLLIEAGAELELVDKDGRTALHYAVTKSSPSTETIEGLLHAGANVNHVNEVGLVPIHEASFLASGSAIELLIAHGADVDAVTHSGSRAIDTAVYRNTHEVFSTLLKHSASLDHHWEGGYASYSWIICRAATYGDVATMRLLAEARLTDISMDREAVFQYWYWFDTRPPPLIDKGESPEALTSAYGALLNSITPLKIGQAPLITWTFRPRRILVPGAFPIDESKHSEDDASETTDGDLKDADDDLEDTDDDLEDTDDDLEDAYDESEAADDNFDDAAEYIEGTADGASSSSECHSTLPVKEPEQQMESNGEAGLKDDEHQRDVTG